VDVGFTFCVIGFFIGVLDVAFCGEKPSCWGGRFISGWDLLRHVSGVWVFSDVGQVGGGGALR